MRFNSTLITQKSLIVLSLLAEVSGHESGCCFVEISDKESFSEIKEANELTHQSDIWETIARELGHEIKNPLTGIRGTTQLLKRGTRNFKI